MSEKEKGTFKSNSQMIEGISSTSRVHVLES